MRERQVLPLAVDVYADGKSLSEALLNENLAIPYNGGNK